MLYFSSDIFSEIIKYLEIDDICELSLTCQHIHSLLKRKPSEWAKLIKWEVFDLRDTLILLFRKIGAQRLTKSSEERSYLTLENPIGSNFEEFKISYHNVESKKYYIYVDEEQRTIIRWTGKEFGRIRYQTLENLVHQRPKKLEKWDLSKELLKLFDHNATVSDYFTDSYEYISEIEYLGTKIKVNCIIYYMKSLDLARDITKLKFTYADPR